MSLRRRIVLVIVLVAFGAAACLIYGIVKTVRRVPEAYAAWDTGTILVEYMKLHGNRWPSSWDDLLSIVRNDSNNQIVLYGSKAGDTNYAASLRSRVAIDWKFDPAHGSHGTPVTRLDGTRFPMVWKGAEPNDMVYRFIKSSVTNATEFR